MDIKRIMELAGLEVSDARLAKEDVLAPKNKKFGVGGSDQYDIGVDGIGEGEPELDFDQEDDFSEFGDLELPEPKVKDSPADIDELEFNKKYEKDWWGESAEPEFFDDEDGLDNEMDDEMDDEMGDDIPLSVGKTKDVSSEPDYADEYDKSYWPSERELARMESVEDPEEMQNYHDNHIWDEEEYESEPWEEGDLEDGNDMDDFDPYEFHDGNDVDYDDYSIEMESVNETQRILKLAGLTEADSLKNGYGNEKTYHADDTFPNGPDAPVTKKKGMNAKQGDNPLANKLQVTEMKQIKKQLWEDLKNFKK